MLHRFFTFITLVFFSIGLAACGGDPMPPGEEQPPTPPQDQQAPAGQQQQAPAAPGLSEAAEISDDDLESFVEVNIRAVRDEIDPQSDPQAFEDAVEDEGLDVEQYIQIHAAIQQDPQLQQEVQRLFQELEPSAR